MSGLNTAELDATVGPPFEVSAEVEREVYADPGEPVKESADALEASCHLSTLPVAPLGNSRTTDTRRGYLNAARRPRQKATSSSASTCAPGLRVTKAATSSPKAASGIPTTAASATAAWARRAASTSPGTTE